MPLPRWIVSAHLITPCKGGLDSLHGQFSREPSQTQFSCGWLHRLSMAMSEEEKAEQWEEPERHGMYDPTVAKELDEGRMEVL